MTYVVKTRVSPTVIALYTCPEHGVFECEVKREENGDAPETIPCPIDEDPYTDCPECRGTRPALGQERCGYCKGTSYQAHGWPATWTPSAAISCRVRRIEAVKGKWEKPERKTYLDTRELAEGMDIDDFRAKRAAVWEEKRQQDVMAVKKGFG